MCRMDPGIPLETLRRSPNYRDVERIGDCFDDPWKRPVQPGAGCGIAAGQGTEEAGEMHPVGRSLAILDGSGSPRTAAPAFAASK